MAGLKLHEHIDVAVWAEVVSKDGAEESEPRDVMPAAERRHCVTIDGNVRAHALHDTAGRAGPVVPVSPFDLGGPRAKRQKLDAIGECSWG